MSPEAGSQLGAQPDAFDRALVDCNATLRATSLLVSLAGALKVSTDILLGAKPVRHTPAPKTARLPKRLQRIEELPPADQRTVLKLVDAMLETRRRSAPPPRAKRKLAQRRHDQRKSPTSALGRASSFPAAHPLYRDVSYEARTDL
jgi:hypothetical protein